MTPVRPRASPMPRAEGGADPAVPAPSATGCWSSTATACCSIPSPSAGLLRPVHGEWQDCGIVRGEAIFVSIGGVLGAKRALWGGEITRPLEERIERIASRVVCALDASCWGMDAAQARPSARSVRLVVPRLTVREPRCGRCPDRRCSEAAEARISLRARAARRDRPRRRPPRRRRWRQRSARSSSRLRRRSAGDRGRSRRRRGDEAAFERSRSNDSPATSLRSR